MIIRALQNRGQLQVRRGFTAVEILIVVAIMLLLISLAVYGLAAAKKAARRAETVARLNAISMAIHAYYADFSMYPPSSNSASTTYAGLEGSQILTECLMGWQPLGTDGGDTSSNVYGFRMKKNGVGKVYGPYINPDPKTFNTANHTFIDARGYSILYYKAASLSRGATTRPVTAIFGTTSLDSDTATSANFITMNGIFQAGDNTNWWNTDGSTGALGAEGSQASFLKLIGSSAGTNVPAAGDVITGQQSFLLVAPGEDNQYFTADDVVSDTK